MAARNRIFIAHATEDKPKVRDLYSRLKERGFDPWIDEIDLVPGQRWNEEIPKAINGAAVFLACFSKSSVGKKGYVQRELRYALSAYADLPPGSIYLIPVRLDDCEVPDVQIPNLELNLRELHWVDLFDDPGFERLLHALNQALGDPDRSGRDELPGQELEELITRFFDGSPPERLQLVLAEADENRKISILISAIFRQWAERGGVVNGKRRNSIRQLQLLLGDYPIRSLRPKIDGRTRLTSHDIHNLMTTLLQNWDFNNDQYEPYSNEKTSATILHFLENLTSRQPGSRFYMLNRDELYELVDSDSAAEIEPPAIRLPSSRIVDSAFDGSKLSIRGSSTPGRDEPEKILDRIGREARRLEQAGTLRNLAPILDQAISDYVEVLPDTYEELDQIKLGLEGLALEQKFEGAKVELEEFASDKKGQIDALLVLHGMLASLLPEWQALLKESSLSGFDATDTETRNISDETRKLADEWSENYEVIDKKIPDTIRFYKKFLNQPLEETTHFTFALLRLIEDVVRAPIAYVLDTIDQAGEKAKPMLSKSLAVIFTASVTGILLEFASRFPNFLGWISKGIEYIKQLGLLPLS